MIMRFYHGLGVGHAHVRDCDWSFDQSSGRLQGSDIEDLSSGNTGDTNTRVGPGESVQMECEEDSSDDSVEEGAIDEYSECYTDDEEFLAMEDMYAC
jgi:hypothetical protein